MTEISDPAAICGDVLIPGRTCQNPRWKCLVQDHSWSDGNRTITWKGLAEDRNRRGGAA